MWLRKGTAFFKHHISFLSVCVAKRRPREHHSSLKTTLTVEAPCLALLPHPSLLQQRYLSLLVREVASKRCDISSDTSLTQFLKPDLEAESNGGPLQSFRKRSLLSGVLQMKCTYVQSLERRTPRGKQPMWRQCRSWCLEGVCVRFGGVGGRHSHPVPEYSRRGWCLFCLEIILRVFRHRINVSVSYESSQTRHMPVNE